MSDGIKNIFALLDARRLKEALVQLEAICMQTNDWQLRNRIETLQTSYGYMLQYAKLNMQDPDRQELYNKMLRNAYELAQWGDIALQVPKSSDKYFEHIRTFNQHGAHSYPEIHHQLEAYTEDISTVSLLYTDLNKRQEETKKICDRHESALNELFNKTWTNLHWSETEMIESQEILNSILISNNDKAVFISAITLSITRILDERKVCFLLKAFQHEDVQVSQRSLVGLVIIANMYEERIKLYPTLLSQFSLLHDDKRFVKDLFNVQMQLLMMLETEKVTKKMHDEIIPGIMKNAKLKEGKIRFDENEEGEDMNPEWQEWMDQSGMSEKIKEMGELQIEGADVYMSTFASLKSFPFFHQISHWFYPFDLNHADLLPLTKLFGTEHISPISLMLYSDTFCNSDKYSFIFSMLQMPEIAREQTIRQLANEADITDEQRGSIKDMIHRPKSRKNISRQYIQDLYRYTKIWIAKHANQEYDLFDSPFSLWKNTLLSASLINDKKMKEIADFLFLKERYAKAQELYETFIGQDEIPSAEIYQKLGFIQQKRGNYDVAIQHYEQADILSTNHVWTLKHLAQCHKLKGDYNKALTYYQTIESALPDNLNITTQIGECLVKMNAYEQALACFYKVEYLSKNPIHARRAIAWCSFCMGKHEEALKYYHLLLEEEIPQKQDWMNMGHVYLVNKNIHKAIECYTKAKEYYKEHTSFIEAFMEDVTYLQSFGLSDEDIHITLDLLI